MVEIFKRQIQRLDWLDLKSKLNLETKADNIKFIAGRLNQSKQDVIAYYNDVG